MSKALSYLQKGIQDYLENNDEKSLKNIDLAIS
jgi:hypothetical protein